MPDGGKRSYTSGLRAAQALRTRALTELAAEQRGGA